MKKCREYVARVMQSQHMYRNDYTMGDKPKKHLIGIGAELAFSVMVGLPFKGFNLRDRDDGDVSGIELRSTEYEAAWLMVNERDEEKSKLNRCYTVAFHRGKGLYEFPGWHFGWYVRKHGEHRSFKYTRSDGEVIEQEAWALKRERQLPMDELICLARGIPPERAVRKWAEFKESSLQLHLPNLSTAKQQ